MNNPLERLERKAFQSFWNDGLLDTMVGLVLVVLGLSWWQDVAVMGAVFPAVCAAMWHPLRTRLVEPRLGYVEFSGRREIKNRSFRMGMMGFLSGTMLLGVFLIFSADVPDTNLTRYLVAGLPAFLLSLMALPFAFFTNCIRYFIYFAVLVLVSVITIILELDPGPPILVGGSLILVIGLGILIRFLTIHPTGPETPA